MTRREFITLFGGTAATWPLAARAEQPAMPVIGYLGSGSPDLDGARVHAFRYGLFANGHRADKLALSVEACSIYPLRRRIVSAVRGAESAA